MNEESGKFIVVDYSNIGEILEQFIKREKAIPAQVMRPCSKCKSVSLTLNGFKGTMDSPAD